MTTQLQRPACDGGAVHGLAGWYRGPWQQLAALQPLEKQLRRVAVSTAIDRARQQRARRGQVPGVVGGDAFVHEGLELALPLRHEAAGSIDVGLGPAVAPVEERHAGPDVDRLLVASGEILVETGEEQLLDPAFAISPLRVFREVARRGVGHVARSIGHSGSQAGDRGIARCDYPATARIGQ